MRELNYTSHYHSWAPTSHYQNACTVAWNVQSTRHRWYCLSPSCPRCSTDPSTTYSVSRREVTDDYDRTPLSCPYEEWLISLYGANPYQWHLGIKSLLVSSSMHCPLSHWQFWHHHCGIAGWNQSTFTVLSLLVLIIRTNRKCNKWMDEWVLDIYIWIPSLVLYVYN